LGDLVVLDRFRHLASRLAVHPGTAEEHEAVVDLLVLTVYSDQRITQEEQDSLEQFDLDHTDWDSGEFSVRQYLPASIAKVREAIGESGGADRVLAEAAARITHPEVKATALEACEGLGRGADDVEVQFIHRVRLALGSD
jgi:hypothetical protein